MIDKLVKSQDKQSAQLTCIISDIKNMKQSQLNNHKTSTHSEPPCSALTEAALPSLPAAPPSLPPQPLYSAVTRAPPILRAARKQVRKIAMITDSIGGEKYVRHDLLEKVTKTKITKAKAYGPVMRTRQEGYKFPDKNFSSVVPQVLASDNFDVAIMMAPSVILSNLPPHTPQEQAEEQAREGSQQMVKIATEAIKANSNLQQLIIMQAAPRYDQWQQTNKFANDQLKEALQDVDDERMA